MNSDSAFCIGKTHDICQDYALHGTTINDNYQYAIISDGCSGSPNTDIGSRIICLEAQKSLKLSHHIDEKVLINNCRALIKNIDIQEECLDATLLSLFVDKHNNKISIKIAGDGYVVFKYKNENNLYVISIEFTNENSIGSYPFYLNYYNSQDRFEKWKYGIDNLRYIHLNKISFDKEKNQIHKEKIEINNSFNNDIIDINIKEICNKKFEDIEFISIASDGLGSFYETTINNTQKMNIPLSPFNIIKELFLFKNYNGSFIKRRLKRFLKNCNHKNWYNGDDVSVGAIYFE